jgi:hypothetical protein
MITTEGRIFTAQLTREFKAREKRGAALMTPGAATWPDAVQLLTNQLARQSPTRAAQTLQAVGKRLEIAQQEGICFVHGNHINSRSGILLILTWAAGPHPLLMSGSEGVVVRSHYIRLRRNAGIKAGEMVTSFFSWHALGRLYERSDAFDLHNAEALMGMCGLVTFILATSDKHRGTEINLTFEGFTCTGVLRGTMYDVLTVLPFNEQPQGNQLKRFEQGCLLANALQNYLGGDDDDDDDEMDKYAEKIPVLPFHGGDHVSCVFHKP